jgi:pimeloyl-ACP methyl ester carboxylesterase
VTQRFFYLGVGDARFLATIHPPYWRVKDTSVLLLPPFGWEEVSSHRARRDWADDLATHGYPALRIDLPATGDSAGTPDDQRLWASWNNAVTLASAWLRTEYRSRVVTAIGIGLGGLLAHQGAVRGDVDDLVLWATPSSGRRLLREVKAFSTHESARIVDAGAPVPPALPPGSLAPGGFFISPETVLDLTRDRLPSSARILLLDRDGLKPDPALLAAATSATAHVTVGSGHGFGAMMTDPDRSKSPLEVFERARAWLLQQNPRDGVLGGMGSTARTPVAATEMEIGDLAERPFIVPQRDGALVGVLTEPISASNSSLTAVFLNAGAIRRIGPHRMWVETARRWGRRGVVSLRIDLEGIGDSDGDGRVFADVSTFYRERFVTQTRDTLDALERAGHGNRFLLVGLCSGAYWAFQTALVDRRVASTLMLNPRALHWDQRAEVLRAMRKVPLLAHAVTWKRLINGDLSTVRWRQGIRTFLNTVPPGRQGSLSDVAPDALIAASFDELRARGAHARFAFCDGEPQFDELRRYGYVAEHMRWPNISYRRIPGRDHTLRPLWMHSHVTAELDNALAAELERTQVLASVGAPKVLRPGPVGSPISRPAPHPGRQSG